MIEHLLHHLVRPFIDDGEIFVAGMIAGGLWFVDTGVLEIRRRRVGYAGTLLVVGLALLAAAAYCVRPEPAPLARTSVFALLIFGPLRHWTHRAT